VGVQLTGQVQGRVGGTEVALTAPAIRQAGDLDRAEDRLKRPDMAGLDTCPPAALGVNDVVQALLADRTQVQVVLVELPDQLTQIDRQPLFQLAVGEACGLLITQERTDLLEAVAARAESSVGAADRHGASS